MTAVTADAAGNHRFYTQTLGMRLVKKTVNQDDVSAYHLFYADGLGSPGSDLTFFDWPVDREKRGTGSVVRTGLRVPSDDSLDWWVERLSGAGLLPTEIRDFDGRSVLDFEDPEGQRLRLVVDPGSEPHHPWAGSPVPSEHQIVGLGTVTLSVPSLAPTDHVLRELMGFETARTIPDPESRASTHVYAIGEGGGTARELHVIVEPGAPRARQGAGCVHHVAFRTPDDGSYERCFERLRGLKIASSGPVDRYYFRSLYFRDASGILFEIATDGPGFAVDEPADALGESLALPPFLESRRSAIEAGLKPLER